MSKEFQQSFLKNLDGLSQAIGISEESAKAVYFWTKSQEENVAAELHLQKMRVAVGLALGIAVTNPTVGLLFSIEIIRQGILTIKHGLEVDRSEEIYLDYKYASKRIQGQTNTMEK